MVPSVCTGGLELALHCGTKASVNSIHGRTTPDLPLPPLPLSFSRSFILRRCPELQSATLSPRLQRQQKPSKPSSAAQVTDPEMTTPYRARNASTHIHTHSKTLLPSSPLTHTPSTPPHSPTSLPPPTCQTLLDIQKRKQETCCLPGKCCLHIIRF